MSTASIMIWFTLALIHTPLLLIFLYLFRYSICQWMVWKLARNGMLRFQMSSLLRWEKDRNPRTKWHNGNGRFSPAVLAQSAQKLCHVENRIPSSQSGYGSKCHKSLGNLGTISHFPVHFWTGDLGERCS